MPKESILNCHDDYITDLHFCPYNNTLYSSGLDGVVNCIDIKETDVITPIFKGNTSIYSLDTSKHGNIVAFANYDKEIIIKDIRTNKYVQNIKAHNNLINKICIGPNGKNIISASSDKTICLWDISSGKNMYTFDHNHSAVLTLFATNDFSKIFSGSREGEIYMFDLIDHTVAKFVHLQGGVLDIAMNEPETKIIVSTDDDILYYYDFTDKNEEDEDDDKEEKEEEEEENEDNYENEICHNLGTVRLKKDTHNPYGLQFTIVQNEIEEFELMKNKIYIIGKYKSTNKCCVYNLLYLSQINNLRLDSIDYKDLIKKLEQLDKQINQTWCTVDISLGTIRIWLNDSNCFLNDWCSINPKLLEKIINNNFSPNIELFHSKENNSKKHEQSQVSFGNFIFENIIRTFLTNRIKLLSPKLFINGNMNKLFLPFRNLFETKQNLKSNNFYIQYFKNNESYCFYLEEKDNTVEYLLSFSFPSFIFRYLPSEYSQNFQRLLYYKKYSTAYKINICLPDFKNEINVQFLNTCNEKTNYSSIIDIRQDEPISFLRKNILKFVDKEALEQKIRNELLNEKGISKENKATLEKQLTKNIEKILVHCIEIIAKDHNLIINCNNSIHQKYLINLTTSQNGQNNLVIKYVPIKELIKKILKK